ncbi:MAG: hypothetical protein ACKVQQ_04990 [Burkholderiales bacterium]
MIEREQQVVGEGGGLPVYIRPTMRVMTEQEILVAFQMTAAKISAAGCWWGACPQQS